MYRQMVEKLLLDEWLYIPLVVVAGLWGWSLGWVMGLIWLAVSV
jgi:thiamine transporter ThiT